MTPQNPLTSSSGGGVSCVREGNVLVVTLERPEVRNAMRPSTWAALAAIGGAVPDDVRVVVVRGAGDAFCAGLDTRLFAGRPVGDDAPLTRLFDLEQVEFDRTVETFQQGFTWLRDPRFISVAAVQGHAIGAGFQLALACDIRLAADDAMFSMREAALGLVPDLTGTKNLVEAVGYARALEWTASARFVDAAEALTSGLVSRTVPRSDLDTAVDQLVQGLVAHAHGAVTGAKSLLLTAADSAFRDQLAAERQEQFRRFAAVAAERDSISTSALNR